MIKIEDYINDNVKSNYNGDIVSLETVITAAIKKLIEMSDLIGCVDSLIGTLQSVQLASLMRVFQAQCCHFYGSETWALQDSSVNKFYTTYNRAVRSI